MSSYKYNSIEVLVLKKPNFILQN